MNPILSPPKAVLVVGAPTSRRERLETVLADVADSVYVAESTDRATTVLSEHDDVGCVVLAADCDGVVGFRRTVTDHDEYLPVVLLFDGSVTDVSGVTSAGETTLLPTSASDEELCDIVTDHFETYRDRLVTAEESDMLQSFLSSIEIPMFVKDEQGRHLRKTEAWGGIDPEVVVGKTDRELYAYDPESAEQFYDHDMRVIENGERIVDREEAPGPPGNRYWARTTKVPWHDDDGSVKGLLGLSYEITDLKQQERRLELLEDRFDQFATFLSEEVLDTLQSANGQLGIARETGDDDAFRAIESAHDRMEQRLRDLSTLAGKSPNVGATNSVNLAYVVNEVWSFIATGDAQLALHVPDETLIHASMGGIRPIVEHLLRHAADSGEDVTVSVGALQEGFYVAHDAPTSSADCGRATESGFVTPNDGRGSGLAFVSEVVERNNWSLTATARDESGTRIEIRGPLVVTGTETDCVPGADHSLTESDPVGEGDVTGSVEVESVSNWWTLAGTTGTQRQQRDYYFAHAAVEGDARIEARLVDIEHVNDYGSGGLMVRDGLGPEDPYGFLGWTVGRGTEILWRTDPGGETSRHLLDDDAGPQWLRIDRIGDTVTYLVSLDGSNWRRLDQRPVALSDPIHVGLAVSGAIPTDECEATFADVTVCELDCE